MTPVVFIHYGPVPDYLRIAIKQAHKFNQVFLITDQEETNTEATAVLMIELDEEAKAFTRVYHHLSKNPIEFECRCFTRWGMMKALMEKRNIPRVFYCDSDVLLYTAIDGFFSDYDIVYSTPVEQPPFRWSASGHVSIFSYEKLSALWNYMLNTYTHKTETFGELKSKYKHHLSSGAPGGVCDMTLLYLFSQKVEVVSMCSVIDGTTFDHNINSSENSIKDEYEMRQVSSPYGPMIIKNIRMVDGVPIGTNLDMDADVAFNSLHFQGVAKSLMGHFV